MRRSLRLRLLGLSLTVASLSVVATALLATYGTGTQLREEIESSASLLEADSLIRDSLLDYASEHRDWDGVAPLVVDLALRTGRRIELTTPGGVTIADSAALLGQGDVGRPSTPSARVDAADPPDAPTGVQGGTDPGASARSGAARLMIAYNGWQLTEAEQGERQRLVDQAVACLAERGIDATLVDSDTAGGWPSSPDNRLFVSSGGPSLSEAAADACVPEGLNEPSAVAQEVNARAVALATACLDASGLDHEVVTSASGLRLVQPGARAAGSRAVPRPGLSARSPRGSRRPGPMSRHLPSSTSAPATGSHRSPPRAGGARPAPSPPCCSPRPPSPCSPCGAWCGRSSR
ncbi:hypothetical protein [Streptomyces sp. 8K308]|uniref:hypothetical protein n=1 Tax=Streptomyces sp. 8K308 TaxID=2530388 RepID=UPI001A9E1373|nr:hypothetical protein [Streptomyces sp. 8K308]